MNTSHITADFGKNVTKKMINQCSGSTYNVQVSVAPNCNVCQIYRITVEYAESNLDPEATAESKAEAERLRNEDNILMKQEKHHEALANYTKEIQLDDQNVAYYCVRAIVHKKLGNNALAITHCQTALRINPSSKIHNFLGCILLDVKEYHEALVNFTKAIQLNDQNVVYYHNRAAAHIKLGNRALAIKDCRRALSINPSCSKVHNWLGSVHNLLGSIFLDQKEHHEALANFTKAIQLDDHIAAYYCNRAIAHTTLDNDASAIKDCHTALSIDPSHISTYVQLGHILMKQEKHHEALANYTKAIQLDDQNVTYYCNRAAVHKKLGNHALAITDCQTALSINPSCSEAYNLLGNILLDQKEHREALANFTKAIQLDNHIAAYYCNRAIAHITLGNHGLATKDCHMALSIDPSYSKAYARLGLILRKQEKYHEALANFTKAIQLDNHNIEYYISRAIVHEKLGNHALGIKDHQTAFSINPSCRNIHNYLKNIHLLIDQEEYHEALASYTKAIQLDDRNAEYYCNRAATHYKLDNHALAIKDCHTALFIDSSHSNAYTQLGHILMKQEKHHEALANYTKAIQLDDQNITYYCNRATVHKKLGNHDLAITDCQTALSINPSCSKTYNLLGNILLDEKEYHEALTNFTKAIQLDDQNVAYYCKRADVHRKLSNHALAITDCQTVFSINSSYSEAYNLLGNIFLDEKKHHEALANFTKAIQLDDHIAAYYCNRAIAHITLDNHSLATKDCHMALSIDPSYSKAYARLGLVLRKQEKYHEALANFTKAIQLDNHNLEYYISRAIVHEKLGNRALGIKDHQTALSINPSCRDTHNYLKNIHVLIDQEEYHEALASYTKLIQLNGVVAYHYKAVRHSIFSYSVRAIKDSLTALSIDSSNNEAYTRLGLAFCNLGVRLRKGKKRL